MAQYVYSVDVIHPYQKVFLHYTKQGVDENVMKIGKIVANGLAKDSHRKPKFEWLYDAAIDVLEDINEFVALKKLSRDDQYEIDTGVDDGIKNHRLYVAITKKRIER